MSEPVVRNPRQVSVADHLWESFGLMSQDMGVDRDALINQALFAFARQHGYLTTTSVANRVVAVDHPPASQAADAAAPAEESTPEPGHPPFASPPPEAPRVATGVALTSVPPMSAGTGFTGSIMPVLELPVPEALPEFPPPELAAPEYAPPEFAPPEGDLGLQMAASEAPSAGTATAPSEGVLVLYAEGREVDRVINPRFLIGRGKHCDLIINSGKVSREHAAIIREGEAYFIEDLGSSNGTWFDKKRITRRKIDEGDEYFVCSEKITCRFV